MHALPFLEDYETLALNEEAIDEEIEVQQPAPSPRSHNSRWRTVEEYQEWRALRHDLADVLAENDPD
jgi:hypothetical protein